MLWQILCLTQSSRHNMFMELAHEFQKQGGGYDIGLLSKEFDPKLDLGQNRNELRGHATAEYISYFDDDDFPSANYISRIRPLLDGIDYVGHKVQIYCSHMQYCEYGNTDHSLDYKGWTRHGMNFLRDISHINPIRRELAIQSDFVGGYGEDERWARALREKGIVKTQHYIPEVMYHYIWRAVKDDERDFADPRRQAIIERIKHG